MNERGDNGYADVRRTVCERDPDGTTISMLTVNEYERIENDFYSCTLAEIVFYVKREFYSASAGTYAA